MKALFCGVLFCVLVFSATLALTVKEEEIARFAVGELGAGYSLIKVTSVDSQVVRGTMYHVRAKVGYQVPGGISKKYNCYMKVWEKPNGRKSLQASNCK